MRIRIRTLGHVWALCILTMPFVALADAGALTNSSLTRDAGPMRGLIQAFLDARNRDPSAAADTGTVEVIHVSPSGNDDASGRKSAGPSEGPVRTLPVAQARARELVRAMKEGQRPVRPIHVVIEPGVYRLHQTWMFDGRDSGQPGAPVVYRASRYGSVQLSGGVEMNSSSPDGSRAGFTLPPDQEIDWRGARQLFVDGRRVTLARMPDEGKYWYVPPPSERPPSELPEVMPVDAPIGRLLDAIDAQDRQGIVLHLFQSWTTGRHRVDVGAREDTWKLSPAPRWPYARFGRSQRFYVENLMAALDAPGEWIGAGRTVTYLPLPAERGRTLTAVLPTLSTLVSIGAAGDRQANAHDLEFRGIDFSHTVFVTPPAGYTDNQAASTVSAAIEVDRARRIVIDRCRVNQVGGYGIWLGKDVRDSTVSNTLLDDLGAGGLRVGDRVGPVRTDAASTVGNRIARNMITGTGKVLPGGVGIWVGQAWDNEITHNVIANTTYTGISVGWKWGFGSAVSGGNVIAGNLLVNIGQGMLADLGGIYSLGESPGTVIEGNVIREVRAYSEYGPGGRAGAWGIYQDEGSSDTFVRRNVVVGTDSGGYHMHYGRNNEVRANLFANGDQAELTVSKSEGGTAGVIAVDNAFVAGSPSPFAKLASEPIVQFRGNLLSEAYRTSGDVARRCAGGCRFGPVSVTVGSAARDVSIRGVAPELAEAWRDVIAEAGPTLPELGSLAIVSRPNVRFDDVRSTRPVRIAIADTPVGGRPLGLNYRPASQASAIQVEKRMGVGEPDRCLSFRDGPEFPNAAEPFAFATLGRASGPWTATFTLWTDGGSDFVHEWRDNGVPYRSGPRLEIVGGELRVNGTRVASILPRTWYTFGVSANLGDSGGNWSLEITGPDGSSQQFQDLPLRDKQWRELRWVGLISASQNATNACVGKLEVAPSLR